MNVSCNYFYILNGAMWNNATSSVTDGVILNAEKQSLIELERLNVAFKGTLFG